METKKGQPRARRPLANRNLDVDCEPSAEELRIISRSKLLGKWDPSWSGPGPFGLRHWSAAYDHKAMLGTAFYAGSRATCPRRTAA
jgi:hypothetical protein